MDDHLTREEAAQLFVNRLVARAYDGTVQGALIVLDKGPAGGRPLAENVRLHEWYQRSDEETRARIKDLIRYCAHSAVFGCCALLDGVTGGYPIPGSVSNFSLYLKVFATHEDEDRDEPQFSIRISPEARGEDLHDLLNGMLEDRRRDNS